jgi:ATP-binding cassette subfamily B protein
MAFEDATLFSASVRDNVLLGREDLISDDPETVAAAGFEPQPVPVELQVR